MPAVFQLENQPADFLECLILPVSDVYIPVNNNLKKTTIIFCGEPF